MRTYFFLLLFLVFTLLSSEEIRAQSKQEVRSGEIDLYSYSFDESGSIPLNGQWMFIENKFIDPQTSFSIENSSFITVPSSWRDNVINEKKLSSKGFGTYYVKIILPPSNPKELALKIPSIGSAYRAYINGRKVVQTGTPAIDKSNEIPFQKPVIVPIDNQGEVITLMIHVSNYHFAWGGIWDPIRLGDVNEFAKDREKSIRGIFFYCGLFFMMTIFHIVFFILRKDDYLSLSFTLITLITIMRILSTDNLFIIDLIPQISFSTVKKMDYISYFLAFPILINILKFAFPKEGNKIVIRSIQYIGLAATIIVLTTPPHFFTEILYFYQIFSIIVILYSLYMIILAKLRQREGASILIFGLSMLFLALINDILFANRIIQTGYHTRYGITALILTQSILINFRFAKAFVLNKNLSLELKEKNLNLTDLTQNLEIRVKERTVELQKAYLDIKALSLTDELTNLPNRRSIMELLKFEEKKVNRNDQIFTIGLLDIDNFKFVNDTYGHDMGDIVLKRIANVTNDGLRQQDQIARWGGEEFLLLFPDSDLESSFIVAERVRQSIQSFSIQGPDAHISVTVTIGICSYTKGMVIDEVIKKADEGLYIGKNNGKNQVVKLVND